jgi:hypothetical protein
MTACLLMPWRGTGSIRALFCLPFSGVSLPHSPVLVHVISKMNKRDHHDTRYAFAWF